MERKQVDRGGLRSGLFQAQSWSDPDSAAGNFHLLPGGVVVPSDVRLFLGERSSTGRQQEPANMDLRLFDNIAVALTGETGFPSQPTGS